MFSGIGGGEWLVLLAVVIYRMLSTNIAARQHENDAALALLAKPFSTTHSLATASGMTGMVMA